MNAALMLAHACGLGAILLSSARFVAEHKQNLSAGLSIHGVEKTGWPCTRG